MAANKYPVNRGHVWQRGFLPINEQHGHSVRLWYQTDSEDNYWRQGNRAYGPEDITYVFNQFGYRCKEFDAIDHSAFKLLVIGCSNTLGIGLPLAETYGEQLAERLRSEHRIRVEAINLGLGGRSVDYIARTLYQSIPILCPHYVFCLFPCTDRREYFLGESQLHYLPGWEVPGWEDHREALLTLSNDQWDLYSFIKNLAFIDLILQPYQWAWATWQQCKLDTSYFDATHYREHISHYRCDKARDNIHFGSSYHRAIADDLMGDDNLRRAMAQYLATAL